MGRGVSSGGGQSSLGYLFGSDEPPKAAEVPKDVPPPPKESPPAPILTVAGQTKGNTSSVSRVDENGANPDIPAGKIPSNPNNYHRAEGQNTGNFITDRPSTKVHSAPGGGSSLGYLFGGGN